MQVDFSVLYNYKSDDFKYSLDAVSHNIIKVAKGKKDDDMQLILNENAEFTDAGMVFKF